jgi:hypothetical protein
MRPEQALAKPNRTLGECHGCDPYAYNPLANYAILKSGSLGLGS